MFHYMSGMIGIILLCLAAGGMLLFVHTLYVKTTLIHLTAAGLPPLTLVHLTDLHGRTRYLNGSLHRLVNRWEPDLVFCTGDLAQHRGQLPRVMKEIAKIRAQHGICFVPGNYERQEARGWKKRAYTAEEYASCKEQWQAKMTVLENKEVFFAIGDARIRVYGFDNSTYGNERYEPDKEEKAKRTYWTVLLAHSPNILSFIREKGIQGDLLLTGHTHGGQIRVVGRTFGAYKHFHIGTKQDMEVGVFSISRGLGTSRLPFRLNCFPEVTVYLLNQPQRPG